MVIGPQETTTTTTETGFSVTVPVNITFQRIADMMVSVVEGGSADWCLLVEPRPQDRALATDPCWYADPKVWANPDFLLRVLEDVNDDGDPATAKEHLIGRYAFEAGIKLMVEKYGDHFRDIIDENDDANTADVLWQCIVLGDIVYG